MTKNKQSVLAWAVSLVLLMVLGLLVTVSSAQDVEESEVPATQGELAVALALQKESDVSSVTVGYPVVYTVTVNNTGAVSDTVLAITDTLPLGFSFEAMLPSSDVATVPLESDGTLVWTESFTVPVGEDRQVVYQVHAGAVGEAENSVEAETSGGGRLAPASASVTVNPPPVTYVYVPLVTYSEQPATTLPFEDTFNLGVSSDWVVFENYPGLSDEDWLWDGDTTDVPPWGFYYYDPEQGTGWDGYALSMYLGDGSDEWTDYEIVTTLKNRREKLGGLWVRGTYEDLQDNSGGRIGGYYIHLKPANDTAYLWRIRPGAQVYYLADVVAQGRYQDGINKSWFHLKVRVQGPNIKVWLKKDWEPDGAYQMLINWTDPSNTWEKGTVGFSTWRTAVIYNDIKVTEVPAAGR